VGKEMNMCDWARVSKESKGYFWCKKGSREQGVRNISSSG